MTRIRLDPGGTGMPHPLPITIPVSDLVQELLQEIEDDDRRNLDRDEVYLKRRLEDGADLFIASYE